MDWLKTIFYWLALAYGGLILTGLLLSNRMMFPAPPASYKDSAKIIKLKTANGLKVSAVYLPADGENYTILYSHGNAEDLGTVYPRLQEFNRLGFGVMAYDYPGYGTSEGKPSENNANRAIQAAYNYLVKQQNVSPKKIILYGYSLGTGPSFDLASKVRVAGVISEAGFVSAFRVVTVWPLLPFDKFRNLSKLRWINVPILFIHGYHDRVVPFWHSQKLYHAARSPKYKLWVSNGNHVDTSAQAGKQYWQSIMDFYKALKKEA